MTSEERREVIYNTRQLLTLRYAHKHILAETYLYLYLYINCYQWSPTYAEIAEHFRIKRAAAWQRVERLRKLGYLHVPFDVHRGIELTALKVADNDSQARQRKP